MARETWVWLCTRVAAAMPRGALRSPSAGAGRQICSPVLTFDSQARGLVFVVGVGRTAPLAELLTQLGTKRHGSVELNQGAVGGRFLSFSAVDGGCFGSISFPSL